MKIRWKLLLVMLSISLFPLMIMLWYGQWGMQKLGKELATSTRKVLIQKAHLELELIVEEHARILQRERDLVEMALKLQASEIEKRFSGIQLRYYQDNKERAQRDSPTRATFQPSDRHFRFIGMRRVIPLYVSYEEQTIIIPEKEPAYLPGLSSMVPLYYWTASKHPDLFLWQVTAFENGTQTIYPAIRHYPNWYNALKTDWYQNSREKNKVAWSMPTVDPLTGRFVFIASAPLFTDEDTFLGATSIMIPVSVVLQEDRHIKNISENFTSLLIRSEFSSELGRSGVRIVANEQKLGQRRHIWQRSQADEWLSVEAEPLAELTEDLQKRHTGVIEISYNGEESIAAYGSIDAFGSALMLVVRKSDIIAEAARMERYVIDRISSQIHITSIMILGVFIIVIFLALILSRKFTGNILDLVEASRRIATGDFKTRVRIQSNDEMGELGRTFNRMVPALEERIQMKQSMDLAMQVQQNLLPRSMPVFDGLDIAAESIYCDETGGDFFDFIDFTHRGHNVVGVVVGDVSGHGVPAALLMSSARAFLKCRATQPGEIDEIINDVNHLVTRDVSQTSHFLTLFYMEVNTKEKKAEWIRAGHEPAFVYCPDTDTFDELRGKGISMGVDGNAEYHHNILSDLSRDKIILIGTDGVWETKNPAGDMFGKNRTMEIVRKYSKSSAHDILKTIMTELKTFRVSVKQEDDVTLVIMKIK